MKDVESHSITNPPTALHTLQPNDADESKASKLGSILSATSRQGASVNRYTSQQLEKLHRIYCERDDKVARLIQVLRDLNQPFNVEQLQRTFKFAPPRNNYCRSCATCPTCTGNGAPQMYRVVDLSSVERFEVGITNETIKALYKNQMQTIKRLTGGRR